MTPHAVVTVPNDMLVDTRAQKVALSLRDLGYRVTLVGTTAGPAQAWEVGDIPTQIVSVPRILGAPAPARRGLTIPERRRRERLRLDRMRLNASAGRLESDGPTSSATLGSGGRLGRRVAQRWRGTLLRARERASGVAVRARSVVERLPIKRAGTGWEDMLPDVLDMELAVGPVLDQLEPDLIIPDVHLLGTAIGAADRARLLGRRVAVIYDAREFVGGLASEDANVLRGFPLLEAAFIHRADAVITVAGPIATYLQDGYHLPARPAMVLNAPFRLLPAVPASPSVRRYVGVADGVPLLVYCGGLNHFRGVHTVIEALPSLPGAHLAIVAKAQSSYTEVLAELAAGLSVSDRIHFAPFAPPHEVAEYLSSATMAVIPFLPVRNHEWAAPNKYFESMQARLPIVTSDVPVQAELTTALGNGEVFRAADPEDLARAVSLVLADPQRYRDAYRDEVLDQYSWERQARVLAQVCAAALGRESAARLVPASDAERARRYRRLRKQMAAQRPALQRGAVDPPKRSLLIGPRNTAGQAFAWAQAVRMAHPEACAESMWVRRYSPFAFPADKVVLPGAQAERLGYVGTFSHVLSEAGGSLMGALFGPFVEDESAFYSSRGIALGVVLHGSEARDPARHAAREPLSPFRDPHDELTRVLQRQCDDLIPRVRRFAGPLYVTTPDLLEDFPEATWLPVVVDTDQWAPGRPALSDSGPPVVVHAPTSATLKGSVEIDRIAQELDEKGWISYRRLTGVPQQELADIVRGADIVLDQFALGSYGVFAAEAMSAQRLVIGHVADGVRSHSANLPIVESTPETFLRTMEAILDDRADAAKAAVAGSEFVRRWHDGTASAAVLADFLGLGPDRSKG